MLYIDFLTDLWTTSPSFFVGFAAFIVAWRSLIANSRSTKVKNSIDFESSYKHKESIKQSSNHVLKLITTVDNLPENLFKIAITVDRSYINNDYDHINDFLNEWERCANGVYYGVYDEKFLYGTYATTVIESFKRLLPFVIMRQGDKRDRVYIKLAWLALKWTVRRNKENGFETSPLLLNALDHLQMHHDRIYSKRHKRIFLFIWHKLTFQPTPRECLKVARINLFDYICSELT